MNGRVWPYPCEPHCISRLAVRVPPAAHARKANPRLAASSPLDTQSADPLGRERHTDGKRNVRYGVRGGTAIPKVIGTSSSVRSGL